MPQEVSIEKAVRSMMVIYGALIMGVLSYLAVALGLGPIGVAATGASALGGASGGRQDFMILTYIAAGYAAMSFFVAMAIPPIADRINRARIARQMGDKVRDRSALDEAEHLLAGAYTTRTLLYAAVLEGAALFNLTAYLLEAKVLSLGAAGLMLMAMAVQYPSTYRVGRWVEGQKEQLVSGA